MPSAGTRSAALGGGCREQTWVLESLPRNPVPTPARPPCLIRMQFTEEVKEPSVHYQEASARALVKGDL